MDIPIYSDIEKAHQIIQKYAHRTPVFTSKSINKIVGGELHFKCENFQKVGAFKFRGACNAVFSLSEKEARKGVATHSSGNHAAALALAAKMRGIDAHIVMPDNSPEIKKRAVAVMVQILLFANQICRLAKLHWQKLWKQPGRPKFTPTIISM